MKQRNLLLRNDDVNKTTSLVARVIISIRYNTKVSISRGI